MGYQGGMKNPRIGVKRELSIDFSTIEQACRCCESQYKANLLNRTLYTVKEEPKGSFSLCGARMTLARRNSIIPYFQPFCQVFFAQIFI
jgi:hypothetical protein